MSAAIEIRSEATATAQGRLLAVQDLSVSFPSSDGPAMALDGVSFDVMRGEVLALVGESGSGKSLTALAVMGLLPTGATVESGRVVLDGQNLIGLPTAALNDIRGAKIGMVFQEPMTSLNPVLTIGRQLTEGLEVHRRFSPVQARTRARELLTLVGIPDAARRLAGYPHQLSGGMRQRVMIAMAVACEPSLIIADEPTTALDVSIQAQVLDLLLDLRQRSATAVLLITHDLGVVAEMADRIAVLYAGHVVEVAPAEDLFDAPRHPYTEGLLAAVPRLDDLIADSGRHLRLAELPGSVPGITARPSGCPFTPRCPLATPRCAATMPPMTSISPSRVVACWERAA